MIANGTVGRIEHLRAPSARRRRCAPAFRAPSTCRLSGRMPSTTGRRTDAGETGIARFVQLDHGQPSASALEQVDRR